MKYALAFAGLAVFGFALLGAVSAQGERSDCPGRIVCPQTGELICRDKCQTVDPTRPDCPGRILCPETGKLVCIDRCPLQPTVVSKPSCCEGGK